MAYRSILDRFDMERGDALTLTLETATELAALPCEIAAPVIYALLSWFAGGDVPTLPDPRDNALLLRLVVHQKRNAARRADVLATKRENRMGKGRCKTPATESGENARQRPSTGATDKKREDKSSLDEDLSYRAACASPAAGVSANADPADLKGAVQTAVYFSGLLDPYGTPDRAGEMGHEPMHTCEITNADFLADPVTALLQYPDFETDADKAKFRNALMARFKADKRQFMLTAWKYLADAHRARLALLAAFRGRCADCKEGDDMYCDEGCPNEHLKTLLKNYAKDYGCEVFARNLLGRLKVLKP